MSQDAVQFVLGKAILDADFRLMLFANPDQALAGFNLTPAEKINIRKMDSETLDLLAGILDAGPGRYFAVPPARKN